MEFFGWIQIRIEIIGWGSRSGFNEYRSETVFFLPVAARRPDWRLPRGVFPAAGTSGVTPREWVTFTLFRPLNRVFLVDGLLWLSDTGGDVGAEWPEAVSFTSITAHKIIRKEYTEYRIAYR